MNEEWVWPAIVIAATFGAVMGMADAREYPYNEMVYAQEWCQKVGGYGAGHPANTIRHKVTGRVLGFSDCITEDYVIEVDFGKKWRDCIAQALWYSMNTGLKAKCVLITKPYGEYHRRALFFSHHYTLPVEVDIFNPPGQAGSGG